MNFKWTSSKLKLNPSGLHLEYSFKIDNQNGKTKMPINLDAYIFLFLEIPII